MRLLGVCIPIHRGSLSRIGTRLAQHQKRLFGSAIRRMTLVIIGSGSPVMTYQPFVYPMEVGR